MSEWEAVSRGRKRKQGVWARAAESLWESEFSWRWLRLHALITLIIIQSSWHNSATLTGIVEHQPWDKGVVNIPGVNRWGRIRTKPKTSSNINLGWLSTVCQICQVINKTFGWSLRSLLSVSVEQAGTPNALAAGARQFRAELIEINAKNRSNHPYPRGSMGYWD